jgi:hypothetical protein
MLGAMVLAHSLRDNGTKAKLVALVTLESLSDSTVHELKVVLTTGEFELRAIVPDRDSVDLR